MTSLIVHEMSIHAGTTLLVDQVSFEIVPGELIVLLGPNGAGKTTLLRGALGLETNTTGTAHLDTEPISAISSMERAQRIAYLPQVRPLAWPNRVRDVVSLGRYAHGVVLGHLNPLDAKAVEEAIVACNLTDLSERRVDTLSGGELARVHCARAFAANTPLLIADEPTAALDPLHQHQILGLLQQFVQRGGGAMVVLHDVNLAARYADRLLWMQRGQLVANGSPATTLTAERIETIYDVRAEVYERDGVQQVVIAGPA